jgi:hypothetical protein
MTALERYAHQRDKFLFYAANALRLLVPGALARRSLPRLLARLEHYDAEELRARVGYCARLSQGSRLGEDAVSIGSFRDVRRWTYFFDLRATLVHFDPRLRFHYVFGDVTRVPEHPAFVKSRPIGPGNENSVLLKLNRIRHFRFVEDRRPFLAKRPLLVWRGNARHEPRRAVLRRFHAHPRCDVGHTGRLALEPAWHKPPLSIREQLEYKYVLNVEGNDVATSLKWAMASQSLCLMVRPKYETWFLEGQLEPGRHYVELAEDYSDLEARLDHYEAHPEEAQAIIANANRHVAQFRDPERERLIALLVAARYFERTGQAPAG